MKRIVILFAAMLLGAGAAALAAQSGIPAAPCPDQLAGTPSLVCACTAEQTAEGGVWGEDLYTDDSDICRAAVHAGVIPASGGNVWVFERPGIASYPATTRHGIASSRWDGWRRSIAFRVVTDAPRTPTQPAAEACPANIAGRSEGFSITCGCTIEAMSSGSIWGDQAYTADSILCRAARHAGVVGAYGGTVRARLTAGRQSYPAASRNGISSSSWASYRVTLEFDR